MSIKEKLESLGRNSIQLKIAGKETHKLGATRFGGKPDVPSDFVWPTYEGESYDHVVKDRPLTFLAQFNCAELAQFDKEHLLPDHGLLSFFYETVPLPQPELSDTPFPLRYKALSLRSCLLPQPWQG